MESANLMDSRTSHLDDVLGERLEAAFLHQTADVHAHEIAKIASEYSAIDLAYAASRLPPRGRVILYENLPNWEAKVKFIIGTDDSSRTHIFRELADEDLVELLGKMPADEAVWVLDNMPDRRVRRLVERLKPQQAAAIAELQRHGRYSAGRLMTNEFFAFTSDVTIGEAADYIRNHPGIDLTSKIFVLGPEGELQGYVPSRNLIINPRDLSLQQVMQPIHHTVSPDTSREEVVDLAERYKITALPVIDGGKLVGVITYEDVIEVIEDLADETIAQMAGTLEDVSAHESIAKRFFSRAPWLVVTLCGGLINAANMAYFESTLSPWMAFMVFFVPLITGMSGNVGVQCSTVLVRSMAIGEIASSTRAGAISKEIWLGLITGLVFGILCGVAVLGLNALGVHHLADNGLAAGVVISAGLFGACVAASLLGVFSPLFFARIGIDPAVSSGPIVTAFNDVFSMIMYFLIAKGVSTLFVLG